MMMIMNRVMMMKSGDLVREYKIMCPKWKWNAKKGDLLFNSLHVK